MNKPTDYPIEPSLSDANSEVQASDITYADLRNRIDQKKPVTDEMISIARKKMDAAQGISADSVPKAGKFKLGRIRDKFKSS